MATVFTAAAASGPVQAQRPPVFPDRGAMVMVQSLQEAGIPVPETLKTNCRTWSLVLLIDVDATGEHRGARLEKSSGDALVDAAAIATAPRWKYMPANIGGIDRAGTVRIPRTIGPDPRACSATASGARVEPVIDQAAPSTWTDALSSTSPRREAEFIVALDARGEVLWTRIAGSVGDPAIDEAARGHLPVRYRPALRDGRPVRSFVRIRVPIGGVAYLVPDPMLDQLDPGD